MPKHRLSRTEEVQVDPFSAGEPELPWAGEPEPLGGEKDPQAADVLSDEDWVAETSGQAGSLHADDDYVAPTKPQSHYDAPSTDEPASPRARKRAARQQWRRAVEAAGADGSSQTADTRHRSRPLRIAVSLIVAVSLLGSVISCVGSAVENVAGAASDALDSLFSEDDQSSGGWSDTFSGADASAGAPSDPAASDDQDDQAVADALEARLDVLLAEPSSGELHELVAGYLSDKVSSLFGYTTDELGIDADAWATWYLGTVSFEMDSGFAYGDGSGTAYAYLSAPDANTFVWDFYGSVSDYLFGNGLWGRFEDANSEVALPSEEQRTHIRSVFDDVTAAAEPVDSQLVSSYVNQEGDAWVVDEQDLTTSLTSAFGLY